MKLKNTLGLIINDLTPDIPQENYLQTGTSRGHLWTVVSGRHLYPLGDFNEYGGGFKILGVKHFFARFEKRARGITGQWIQDLYPLSTYGGFRRGEMPIIYTDTSRGASLAMPRLNKGSRNVKCTDKGLVRCPPYEGVSLRDIETGIGRALDFTRSGAFYRETFQPAVTHTSSLKLAKENEWRPSKHQTDHAARHYF